MGNEATYFPSITPMRGFYANTGYEIESTATFPRNSAFKNKGKATSRYRWEISGFTFACLGKVRDSSLALRALNSMVVIVLREASV